MRKYKAGVLVFLSAFLIKAQSFSNGQAARAVIGQPSFTYAQTTAGQSIVGGVSGLAYANGTLFVADSNHVGSLPQNNRVLSFNTTQIPALNIDLRTVHQFNPLCYLCGFPAENVLGQPNYTSTTPGVTSQALQSPTGVATDGNMLAVADTDNNRVLIWTSIPSSLDAPANIVLGQPNFTTGQSTAVVSAQTLRGPQGVWFQNGKLFVADTQNFRVLIWNRIPTQNNQAADLELGQPNFNTANQPPVGQANPTAAANQLLNPASVTSDGTRLYVADLGFNRVLIWNRIPSAMDQPADIVIGQPDMTSTAANNTAALCPADTGTGRCEKTLNFPRFVLSDGNRLFIADGGNDRVLVFNSIPSSNGVGADAVLGQPDFVHDVVANQTTSIISTSVNNIGSVDTVPSPMSLALDDTSLYVSDPYNHRVLVFTPGNTLLPPQSVLNHASEIIRQEGIVTLAGTIVAKDTVTVTIAGKAYTYTILSSDTLASVAKALVNLINAGKGDPNVTAMLGQVSGVVYLSSRNTNLPFDSISLAAKTSNIGDITATASGGYLTAGTAATVAPGTVVEINGTNLSDNTVTTPLVGNLPTEVGGTEVFIDGFAVPVWMVSPTQVIAQVPYKFTDRSSSSLYVRTVHNGGSITVTNATAITIAPANPGLFSAPTFAGEPRPWPAVNAVHQLDNPSAVVSIDGTVNVGDVATITVNGRKYSYTVKTGDLLGSIRDGLITLINSKADPQVTAFRGGAFLRVVLVAKKAGQAGTGIPVAGSVSSGAKVTLTAYTAHTCCAVLSGSPITPANPAVPGETISLSATGLGVLPVPYSASQITGSPYVGPQPNSAANFVSATMNGATAQVVSAGLAPGSYGIYDVQLIVPTDLPTKPAIQVYVAQNAFISNIVTIPVGPASGNGSGGAADRVVSDFDADGKADFVVWRPSNGTWYILPSSTRIPYSQQWGLSADTPISGDFDGDGKADFAVWRPSISNWFILPVAGAAPFDLQWGLPGDVPLSGDFDASGRQEVTVWRGSTATWYIVRGNQPSSPPIVRQWGLPGDIPVSGDFDGDGRTDFAVWRPSNSTWFIIRSSTGIAYSRQWGLPTDIPVPADFDGDGKTDLAVWRPSSATWFILPSSGATPYSRQWGLPNDIPVPHDFDGDKKADLTVWRPSSGTWYVRPSTGAAPYFQQWGLPGDIPK